jgi:hypothetical protein
MQVKHSIRQSRALVRRTGHAHSRTAAQITNSGAAQAATLATRLPPRTADQARRWLMHPITFRHRGRRLQQIQTAAAMDRGSGPAGTAAMKESGGERA